MQREKGGEMYRWWFVKNHELTDNGGNKWFQTKPG
jgi:hypothetical protein